MTQKIFSNYNSEKLTIIQYGNPSTLKRRPNQEKSLSARFMGTPSALGTAIRLCCLFKPTSPSD